MDKTAIKTFAIESRRKLTDEIKYKANIIGITGSEIKEPDVKAEGMETFQTGSISKTLYGKEIGQRNHLIEEIKNKGYNNVIEEIAYTWFNRIIAIRYMEVNDYIPTNTRVLSSETEGKIEPDIITDALELDLNYTSDDMDYVIEMKEENKLNELFRFLFIKQCNKLNEILPNLFEKAEDYTELLVSISFNDSEGIIQNLINLIPEKDFKDQVEIIGWLYQYYNTERKENVFDLLKQRTKISKNDIPAVTQLFTPDWIVKYMVENSLGRLWLDGHSNDKLKNGWKYFIEESEQNADVSIKLMKLRNNFKNIKPEEIKIIDPCMGSGHILIYAFDLLMEIYLSCGYSKKEATLSILENNIYGLDIDDRAYQLTYFAIMMKARSYNFNILNKNVNLFIYSIQESNNINNKFIEYLITEHPEIRNDLIYLINKFFNAKNFGSILKVKKIDFDSIRKILNKKINKFNSIIFLKYQKDIIIVNSLINQAEILSRKYDVIVTNPPYMGNRGMNKELSTFLKNNYVDSKSDLSTVLMERAFLFSKSYSYIAMINIPVWMFISTYKNLRNRLITTKTFINMLHLGRGIFGSDFGSTSFILNNYYIKNYISTFRQLFENKGSVDSILQKEKWFFESNNRKFLVDQNIFMNIPGNPIAYWASDEIINSFMNGEKLGDLAEVKQGLATADNNRFLRLWYEVNYDNINFNCKSCDDSKNSKLKWYPYNKGGEYRKWYGNQQYIVNWFKNGYEIKNFKNKNGKLRSRPQNTNYYFKKSITWSLISSSYFGVRYLPKGFIFDVGGPSMFLSNKYYYYIGAFLSSKLGSLFLFILNPTINNTIGDINSIPIILNEDYFDEINSIVKNNIEISKTDWDNYEISWNFRNNHLINYKENNLRKNYNKWLIYKNKQFNYLKNNETKLNKIFSKIYSVDINCCTEEKEITINKADYEKDIKSFISYAVGCMFGRYSLDEEGLIYAGGEFNLDNYSKFVPDDDNIIPVLDTEYFEDDIVGYFVDFVKKVYSEESLEENLDFIAGALHKKGKTSREVIRNYLLDDFFNDHKKMYQKCPIYWQFDSGKQKGFKCLIYMHRYQPDLVARIRTDYLHKTQKAIEENIKNCDNVIETSKSSSEKSKATKDKNRLIKQLDETREYDEALAHIANEKIEIDLDDGVKVNYQKFQDVEIIDKNSGKSKKVNLLKKL